MVESGQTPVYMYIVRSNLCDLFFYLTCRKNLLIPHPIKYQHVLAELIKPRETKDNKKYRSQEPPKALKPYTKELDYSTLMFNECHTNYEKIK